MRNFEQLSAILAGTTIASAIAIVQPYAAMALTGQEVNDIARSVTVLINSSRGENGSGVIISKNGNTYYVLTANHVVPTGEDAQGKIEYTIVAPDKKPYPLDFQTVKSFAAQNVDLAVFEFTSDKDYQVATLSNSDRVTEGVPVFVSGWPRPGAMSSQTGNQTIRQLTDGRISTVLETPLQGYRIGYTNATLGGMSGGPVIDAGGRVVAIHGQVDQDNVNAMGLLQSATGATTQEELKQLQQLAGLIASTDFRYGIPISVFLQLAPQAGLYMNLKVENSPPPELGAPYVPSAKPDERDQIDDLNGVLGTAERVMDAVDRVDNIRRRLPF
jgi:serine protease Do